MPPLCQSCGAELPEGARACMACMRSTATAFVRPTLRDEEDAVEYDCDDLDPPARARVSDALAAATVPFQWEAGLVLAVPEAEETKVDGIFDAMGDGEDEEAVRDEDVGDEEAPDNPEEGPEGVLPPAQDPWGAGEDAFSALGDLYDAADRLFHVPASSRAAADLLAAAGAVRGAQSPFGFNPVLWRTAIELGDQLTDLLGQGASNEDVQAAAEALRDVLAEHV